MKSLFWIVNHVNQMKDAEFQQKRLEDTCDYFGFNLLSSFVILVLVLLPNEFKVSSKLTARQHSVKIFSLNQHRSARPVKEFCSGTI